MKILLTLLFGAVSLTCAFSIHAQPSKFDYLAEVDVNFEELSDASLNSTMGNVKAVFAHFKPALDESSRVVSPLRVVGSADHPTMKLVIEKCVAIFCEPVTIEGQLSIAEAKGDCDRNFTIDVDLSRSSSEITGYYNGIRNSVCIKRTPSGQATIAVVATVHKSPSFGAGMMRGDVFKMMKLQIRPITAAVLAQLKADGARPAERTK